MSRILQMAAVLALAAAHLPTRTETPRRRSDEAFPQPEPPDPDAERIRQELRERRRANFYRRQA